METLNQAIDFGYEEADTPQMQPQQQTQDETSKSEKILRLLVANIISQTNLTKNLSSQGNVLSKKIDDLTIKIVASTTCTNEEFHLLRKELKEVSEKLDILLSKRSLRLEKDSERRKRKKMEREIEIEENLEIVKRPRPE